MRQLLSLRSDLLLTQDGVSGTRLASALAMRRRELWDSNPRLAERIEMRIKDAQHAHRQAHGTTADALRCLAEQHPGLTTS